MSTRTVVPAAPGWYFVTAGRPDGDGDLTHRHMPVIAWTVTTDPAADEPVGAVVIDTYGMPHVIRGGRFAHPIDQAPDSYAQVVRAALDDYRAAEVEGMAAWVASSPAGAPEGDHTREASPGPQSATQPVESPGRRENLGTTTAEPGGAPDLSQQEREGSA